MAKYPNDPHISDKLASLDHELKSVQKRLNAVIASNRGVYGTGGVGGRLSSLSGKVSNLNTSLDERVSELRQAAEEFAQKEQEQQSKAAGAVESAKNGVNITWVGTAVAAAVLGTTTIINPNWMTSIFNAIKEAILGKESVIESPDITITGGKPRVLYEPQLKQFYYNIKGTKYDGQCVSHTYAMTVETVADESTVQKVLSQAGYSSMQDYMLDHKSDPWTPFGVERVRHNKNISCLNETYSDNYLEKMNAELKEILEKSDSKVGYLWLKASNGNDHDAMMYLDLDGNVRINDPGYPEKSGKGVDFMTFANRWYKNGSTDGTKHYKIAHVYTVEKKH